MRKGLSEVFGAFLMLSLTVAAFAIVWPQISNSFSSESSYFKSSSEQQGIDSEELLSLVYWKANGTNTTLYLYNFGSSAFEATEALIGGKLVTAKGIVEPGSLEPVVVNGIGSSVTLLGKGGSQFECSL